MKPQLFNTIYTCYHFHRMHFLFTTIAAMKSRRNVIVHKKWRCENGTETPYLEWMLCSWPPKIRTSSFDLLMQTYEKILFHMM